MKCIEMFAQEIDCVAGRGFSLTEYPLQNGHVYNGIMLFDSESLARADADSDAEALREMRAEEGEEDDEDDLEQIDVIKVHLFENGEIIDAYGGRLSNHIGLQNNQTMKLVKEHLAHYFVEAERRLRHAAEAQISGPGL